MNRVLEGVWIGIRNGVFEGCAIGGEHSDGAQHQLDDSPAVLSHAVQFLFGGGVVEVEEAVYVGIEGDCGVQTGSGWLRQPAGVGIYVYLWLLFPAEQRSCVLFLDVVSQSEGGRYLYGRF